MQTANTSRILYFLVLFTAIVLGFVLSGVQGSGWIPYVLIGLGSLSLGLLLTLLFVKNAGITVSWPALIALGLVVTLMSTALFNRLKATPVPEDVAAVVSEVESYHDLHGAYPEGLESIEMADFAGAVEYDQRQQGDAFTLRYTPEKGSIQTYRSDVGEWNLSD